MSDLISRQAVLVGLASIANAKAKSDAQKALMGRVMFFTEQLPSVEPERKNDSMTVDDYRDRMIEAFHNADCDELIALVVLPSEKEFEHLEWLLKNHYHHSVPERKVGKIICSDEEINHGNIICHALRCRCSECNFVIDRYMAKFINYCPNCGAKVEVEE